MSGSKHRKRTKLLRDKALDSDIWAHYTRSITPVSKDRSRSVEVVDPVALPTREEFGALLDGKVKARPKPASHLPPRSGPVTPVRPASNEPSRPGTMAEAGKRKAPAKPAIDSHLLRRTKRGSGVDARIDLHGMRRDEAYHALLGFLGDCHHRKLKLVLVITGKGTNSRQAEDWWDMPEHGVLKRMVPQWLSQPAFSRLVAGHSQAGRADGGSGALYVQIRNSRRTPDLDKGSAIRS
jgi:DNA-nicking Smr family endonuclease